MTDQEVRDGLEKFKIPKDKAEKVTEKMDSLAEEIAREIIEKVKRAAKENAA